MSPRWMLASRTVCLVLSPLVIACANERAAGSSEALQPPADRRGYFAHPEDFFGVYFNSGQPAEHQALEEALSPSLGGAEEALEHDLEVLGKFPASTRFTVFGFTDAVECAGQECVDLSQRRADLVNDWFVRHGVSPSRLNAPRGYGNSRPIADNTTKSGQAMNRRAYIGDE